MRKIIFFQYPKVRLIPVVAAQLSTSLPSFQYPKVRLIPEHEPELPTNTDVLSIPEGAIDTSVSWLRLEQAAFFQYPKVRLIHEVA
ncbi:hypothetical protein GK108_13540 [Spirosoma terrae]|uniref:Uncharacterized protein n=1 Tax=Spirosoma terrae TaxID=1968276 RepID=A0A6L9L9T0_9BACT|nr:hypothetical protein [Spirosoma terrae]